MFFSIVGNDFVRHFLFPFTPLRNHLGPVVQSSNPMKFDSSLIINDNKHLFKRFFALQFTL